MGTIGQSQRERRQIFLTALGQQMITQEVVGGGEWMGDYEVGRHYFGRIDRPGSSFGGMGKGPYPFTAREAMYAKYSDRALQHARLDARSARDTADRTAKAMATRYGQNSGAAVEWRSNYGWYADDVHTILKEIRKRRTKPGGHRHR